MIKYFFFLFAMPAIQATAQQVRVTKKMQDAMDRIDTNRIRSHIAYLADDRLKGRKPGTEGYKMAVDYVVEELKKTGVKPGGDNSSYVQQIIIRRSVVNNPSSFAVLKDKYGNADSLSFVRDFTPYPHPLNTGTSAEGQLVFLGYGLQLPNIYSDYSGVDVKGKIAVIIAGAPDGFSSTITAHLRSASNKISLAYSKGALGVIMISLTARADSNMNPVIQSSLALDPGRSQVYGGTFNGKPAIALNGTKSFLTRLLMNSGKNVDSVLSNIKNRRSSSFDLPYSISAGYTSSHTDFESYNVVGIIRGNDKQFKNEYVVHSAHLDHLGIGKPVDGDSIYNGAHDNASGVSSLLEIARLYTTPGIKSKRSILMLFVTAEELGLVGSSYFAANPTVPRSSIVADINTDMPTVIAPLLSIVPLGAEHSSIIDHVRFAADYLKLDVEADPEPDELRFVRSDQYSFVRNGIPALHIKYGNKTNIPGFDMVTYVKEWRAKYYHKPADGMEGIFNFTAAKTYVQLNFLISYSIAQTNTRPAWNKGDLFGLN